MVISVLRRGIKMFGGLGDFFSGLGGMLGIGGSPTATPEALNVAGAEYQGAEANPGRTQFQEPRPDPFARFTPDQRRYLAFAALGDTLSAAGGGRGNSARNMMNILDVQSGQGKQSDLLSQVGQQPEQRQDFMRLQPMPPLAMPPMRPMAINIPRRTALRVPSLLGV